MFDGKGRQRTVSAAGLGRKSASAPTNKEIIENAKKLREQRQEERTKHVASVKIQSLWRGTYCRSRVRNGFRQEFENKLGGVQKIKALFAQAQKKPFLAPAETLLNLLRLFRASRFDSSSLSFKMHYRFLLVLLTESLGSQAVETSVLHTLADSNKSQSVSIQISRFLESGLTLLCSTSSSEDWIGLTGALKLLLESAEGHPSPGECLRDSGTQIARHLHLPMLQAAMVPLEDCGMGNSDSAGASLGFVAWVVGFVSTQLARSLSRYALWEALDALDMSSGNGAIDINSADSELALWGYVSETLAAVPAAHRVSVLRPLVQVLSEREFLGWHVLLKLACVLDASIVASTKHQATMPHKAAHVLLNCVQSVLDDSSVKSDRNKPALSPLFQSSANVKCYEDVVSGPMSSSTPSCLPREKMVTVDFVGAACRIFETVPLVTLATLMESSKLFERFFSEPRVDPATALPRFSAEADRSTAAGVKALELEMMDTLRAVSAVELPSIHSLVGSTKLSKYGRVGFLDKLATLVRLFCTRDMVSPSFEFVQEPSKSGSEQANKKFCVDGRDQSPANLFKIARVYRLIISASAGGALEGISGQVAEESPQPTPLLNDALNRDFSVHNSVLSMLAFSRARDPLSGRLWSLLTHLGNARMLAEALAYQDDWELDQLLQCRLTETHAPLSSYNRRAPSSALVSVAHSAGVSVDTLCAGISDVFVLFCAVYTHQLAATDDEELFTAPHSLPVVELQAIVDVLKQHLYKVFVSSFLPLDTHSDTARTPMGSRLLLSRLFKQTSLTKLWGALYARSERRPFVPSDYWQWAGIVALASDWKHRVNDLERTRRTDDSLDMTILLGAACMKPLLTCLPQMIPFNQRIEILQALITADRALNTSYTHFHHRSTRIRVRRDSMLQDTFMSLSAMSSSDLKRRVQVEFVSGLGEVEPGIDGGGLLKEWADLAAKAVFSPSKGFFIVNSDQLLMPNPASHLVSVPDPTQSHLKYFKAFGRLLGLILYDRILVDAQFAGTFLNALLGRVNQIDDLWVVDKDLHRSLVSLKQLASQAPAEKSATTDEEDPVAALGLTFEVSKAHDSSTVELMPGGSSVPVTRKNVRSYIHRYANFKVNQETSQQCRAFLAGFRELIEVDWLSMFSARELQLLIGGEQKPIDIEDMRRHVNYSGGYSDHDPYIEQFWDIVRHMTPHEQSCLLKFVTSCPRQPLLGFGQLHPHFGIAQVFPYDPNATGAEQEPRLPTAATCMNLLKLPCYDSKHTLREKLLYAITSESGFELS